MTIRRNSRKLLAVLALAFLATSLTTFAAVPHGTPEQARAYYQKLADTLGFLSKETILNSTLEDVLSYLGYKGLTAKDLRQLRSDTLMDPASLVASASNPDLFRQAVEVNPIRAGDVLASRFFAPKIVNVNDPAPTRKLGWRELVRLRARPESPAAKQRIEAAVILFNFFTVPKEKPFDASAVSLNTQVMLIPAAAEFAGFSAKKNSIYWLDYGPDEKLSLQLDASFDAADFQNAAECQLPQPATAGGAPGIQRYYVPDGCVGCHGGNFGNPLVNYLDTDHWFDRIADDFTRVREEGVPVLFDAGTDDSKAPEFARAFDIIRQFNREAEQHASLAQPKAFHRKAAQKWLKLHETSNDHFPPIERAVPSSETWVAADAEILGKLNQYCFRCHGTVSFNVFDKGEVKSRHFDIGNRLQPKPKQRCKPGLLMPPDRRLDPDEITKILKLRP